MTPTPRTDEAEHEGLIRGNAVPTKVVHANFTRELERELTELQRRVIDWWDQSDEGLRLRCGELTAQEIRTIRAVLTAILPPNTFIAKVQGKSI